jgi:hypothetical protein
MQGLTKERISSIDVEVEGRAGELPKSNRSELGGGHDKLSLIALEGGGVGLTLCSYILVSEHFAFLEEETLLSLRLFHSLILLAVFYFLHNIKKITIESVKSVHITQIVSLVAWYNASIYTERLMSRSLSIYVAASCMVPFLLLLFDKKSLVNRGVLTHRNQFIALILITIGMMTYSISESGTASIDSQKTSSSSPPFFSMHSLVTLYDWMIPVLYVVTTWAFFMETRSVIDQRITNEWGIAFYMMVCVLPQFLMGTIPWTKSVSPFLGRLSLNFSGNLLTLLILSGLLYSCFVLGLIFAISHNSPLIASIAVLCRMGLLGGITIMLYASSSAFFSCVGLLIAGIGFAMSLYQQRLLYSSSKVLVRE